MIVDFATQTIDAGPFRIALTAGDGVLNVVLDYPPDPPTLASPPVGDVMVWADGVFVGSIYGQHRVWTPTTKHEEFTFPLASAVLGPGPRQLLANVIGSAGQRVPLVSVTLAGSLATVPAPALVPGKVVRSVFELHSRVPVDDPGEGAAVRAAGVNTLMVPAFKSPAEATGPVDTIEAWRDLMNLTVQPYLAAGAGFLLLATGDELLRTAAERAWMTATPWAPQAVAEAAQRLVAAGVVGIEMVDEVNQEVGAPDSDPAIPLVYAALKSVAGCPPLAWPGNGPYAWEQSPVVPPDYYSRFWASTADRNGRPDGSMTLAQMAHEITTAAGNRPDPKKPWLCLVTGEAYTDGTADGTTATDIVAQVWLALAFGAAGVRVYKYGPDGVTPGGPRWTGLAAAFNAVAAREAVLAAGHSYPAVVDGLWVRGRRGYLSWSINTSEEPQTTPVAGVLLTPAGEAVVSAGGAVPPGGVVLSA